MLFAPEAILRTWRKFDSFPMETLTKAWFYHQAGDGRQREDVQMMKEHYQSTGLPAIVLTFRFGLDEFTKDGVGRLFQSAVRSKRNARMPQSSPLMKEAGAFCVIWETNGCIRF